MKKRAYPLAILFLSPSMAYATQFVDISFDLDGENKYQSKVLLPDMTKGNRYQTVYQSLSSMTLFTEVKKREKDDKEIDYPVTKQVSYGLTVQAKLINKADNIYRFYIEYTGIPSVSYSHDEEENNNKVILVDSPQDIKYEVNLVPTSNSSVCSAMSTTMSTLADTHSLFGSRFCISMPQ